MMMKNTFLNQDNKQSNSNSDNTSESSESNDTPSSKDDCLDQDISDFSNEKIMTNEIANRCIQKIQETISKLSEETMEFKNGTSPRYVLTLCKKRLNTATQEHPIRGRHRKRIIKHVKDNVR